MAVQQISGKLEGPEAAPPAAPGRWRSRGRAFLYRYAVALALALMVVLFSALLPHTFFTVGNFQTIVSSQAVLLILALGLTVPLLVGEFDLSIAAMLGFAAILLTYLTGKAGWAAVPAIAAVLAAGVLVGAVNGLFVVRFGVNAFITTLGTGTVLTGLTLAVSGGQILNGVPQAIVDVASNDFLLGLPAPVFIGLALAVALWFVYDHTPLGRYLFFVGESREVARLAGLRVDRMRWLALVAASVLATVGGILAAGQLGAADPSSGPNFLLPAFAAAFLGATTIKPGRFNAWGTVIAQYVLITWVTGLQLLGASSWVEQVFNGTALVIAVTFARLASQEPAR
jgi:ribose transport system permease protein